MPRSLREHPSVRASAQRSGIPAERLLLDSSFHHRAMRRLPDAERRGRPDIAHLCALVALGSRVAAAGRLRLFLHLYGGEVVSIAPGTRLPRVYDRFKGLLGQLLTEGAVPKDEPLLVVEDVDLPGLVGAIGADRVVALTSQGPLTPWADLLPDGGPGGTSVFLIGGFPRGSFREGTARLATASASVSDAAFESWTIEGELLARMAAVSGL